MNIILCTFFQACGIGLLISPAFYPDLAIWNLIGLILYGIGMLFLPRS